MRLALTAAVAVLAASSAAAEPMWEIADRWVCDMTSHIKIGIDGSDPRINEESNRQVYDFPAGTVTSGFTDIVATIGWTRYTESRYGGFNLIEVLWNGHSYPMEFVETNGEWWHTGASGWANSERRMWIATYRCQAQ